MIHQEFIKLNDGKFVEVAGSANALNQCVDLANAYLRDVLAHPIVEWTNAIDFPEKLTDFEWIENTPDAIPQQGDLMIFFGYYGHISIYHEGNVNTFRSVDQNFPANSPVHIQEHNYNNVFGWLRSPESNTMPTALETCLTDRQKFWDERDELYRALGENIETQASALREIERLKLRDKSFSEHKCPECPTIKCPECPECPECPIIPPTNPSNELKLVERTEESVKNNVKIIKKYGV